MPTPAIFSGSAAFNIAYAILSFADGSIVQRITENVLRTDPDVPEENTGYGSMNALADDNRIKLKESFYTKALI